MQNFFPLLLVALATGCAAATSANERWAAMRLADDEARAALVAEQDGRAPSETTVNAITVLPFSGTLSDPALEPLKYALADFLITDLSQSAQLVVVDRLRSDAMLRELGYTTATLDDSAAAARFGRLVGARQAVTGVITQQTDEQLRLNARVADAETGRVRAGGGGSASVDELLEAEKALALQLFNRLGVSLTPAERERVLARPTRNLRAMLAFGRAVEQELMLNFGQARREYRAAAAIDPDFRVAEERAAQVPEPPPSVDVAGRLATYGVSPLPEPREADASSPRWMARDGRGARFSAGRTLTLLSPITRLPPGGVAVVGDPGFVAAAVTITIIIPIVIP